MSKNTSDLYEHIHRSVYTNVHLLTLVYPATDILKECLAVDMFVKPNKQAFEQVTYFLLKILDPEKVRQSIPWPLYDKKLEYEFRSQVKKFLSSLNKKYEYANIPSILSSHLLTPGGNKFIYILWKLSQLVLMEYLFKNDCENNEPILLPMKARKETYISSAILTNFENIVKHKSCEINEDFMKKNELCKKYANKAKEVYELSVDTEKKIVVEKSKYADFIKTGLSEHSEISDDDFNNSVELLKNKLSKLKNFEQDVQKVIDLTKKIQNPPILNYETNSLVVPNSLKHKMVHKNTDKLDLIEFLMDIKEILLVFTKEFENHDYFDADKLIQIHEKNNTNLQMCVDSMKEYENKLKSFKMEYEVKLDQLKNKLLLEKLNENNDENLLKCFVKSPVLTFNISSNVTNSSVLFKPNQTSFKSKFITPFKTSTTVKNSKDKLRKSVENKNIIKPLFSNTTNRFPSPIEREPEKTAMYKNII